MEVNPKAIKMGFTGALAIGATLIMSFEGYTTKPNIDPVGNAEICYGHKGNIKYESNAGCLRLLKKDEDHANAVIDQYVQVPITQDQRAALIDLIYNEGEGKFASSTLLRKLNNRDYAGACAQFPRWVYADGKVLNGLVRRREAEKVLCLNGVTK